jgi:hypothetical protein
VHLASDAAGVATVIWDSDFHTLGGLIRCNKMDLIAKKNKQATKQSSNKPNKQVCIEVTVMHLHVLCVHVYFT